MTKNRFRKLRAEAERLQELIEEAVLSVQLDELLEETIAQEAHHNTVAKSTELGTWVVDEFLVKWRGFLSSFYPLTMATDGALANSRQIETQLSAVQTPLEEIFDNDTMHEELGWASGHLRIMCARSGDGRIRSLRASVGQTETKSESNSEIVLDFADRKGAKQELKLTSERSSDIARDTALAEELTGLELIVSLRRSI